MNRYERVRNLMSTPPVSIDVSARPSSVVEVLESSPFHHLPVLEDGVLVGMISGLDLARVSLKAWIQNGDTDAAWLDSQFKVVDLMTPEPEFVREADTLRSAADKLAAGTFHALPVLDDQGALVGILTSTDLLRWLAA